MIDKAAIFTTILARQQLRREAQLPALDVRAEYEGAVQHRLWREHIDRHHDEVRAQVLRDYRERHGGEPMSAGGRWWINAKVNLTLAESFQAR